MEKTVNEGGCEQSGTLSEIKIGEMYSLAEAVFSGSD